MNFDIGDFNRRLATAWTGDRQIFDASLALSPWATNFINLPQDVSALQIRFDRLNGQSAFGDNR